MIKKLFSIFLAFIFIFTALPSCTEAPSEDSTPDTTEEIYVAPVLKWFDAKYVGFQQGYVIVRPVEGSKTAEKWSRIYLTDYSDGRLCPPTQAGEIIRIIYDGEIEAMPERFEHPAGYAAGYIKNVHSMCINNDPRVYNGINYGVALLSGGPSVEVIEKHGGIPCEPDMQYGKRIEGMFLVTNREDLEYLMENCVPGKAVSNSRDETEEAKERIARYNERYRLLDGYDDAFFEGSDLLMISIWAGSGSMRFDATDIAIDSGICTLTVEITEMPITDDVKTWTLLVSIPKEVSAGVTEYKTYTPKPEWWR